MDRRRMILQTPLGPVRLEATEVGLSAVTLGSGEETSDVSGAPASPLLEEAARQLKAYFHGGRTAFDLPLDLRGTPFQRRVWNALLGIPFGATRSYGALAREVDRPGAARAVGAANARNPLAIVVPCHRIIGSDGRLTGYAGGAAAKRWLLDHEATVAGSWRQGSLL